MKLSVATQDLAIFHGTSDTFCQLWPLCRCVQQAALKHITLPSGHLLRSLSLSSLLWWLQNVQWWLKRGNDGLTDSPVLAAGGGTMDRDYNRKKSKIKYSIWCSLPKEINLAVFVFLSSPAASFYYILILPKKPAIHNRNFGSFLVNYSRASIFRLNKSQFKLGGNYRANSDCILSVGAAANWIQ